MQQHKEGVGTKGSVGWQGRFKETVPKDKRDVLTEYALQSTLLQVDSKKT